jgi:hypothetical protein
VDGEQLKAYGLNIILRFVSALVATLETFVLLVASAVGAAWGNDPQWINLLGLASFLLIFANGYAGILLLKDPTRGRKYSLAAAAFGLVAGTFTVVVYGSLLGPLMFAIWWIASSIYTITTMAKSINLQRTHPL